MEIEFRNLEGVWNQDQGFWYPDWKIVSDYIKKTASPDEMEEAWNIAARQWLETFQEVLGGNFNIWASPHFFLLTTKSRENGKYWLTVAENVISRIRSCLGEVAWRWTGGKHILLFFDDLDSYYRYISHFYEDGEFPTSSAIFLPQGYCHSAYTPQKDYIISLIHELTHLSLCRSRMPRWLNEGLAQMTEADVSGRETLRLDRELVKRQLAYWNRDTIQAFWKGESFFTPGDASELSYILSEVLVRNIRDENSDHFHNFIQDATYEDYGEAAAGAHLNTTLQEIAASFLGEGEWMPR